MTPSPNEDTNLKSPPPSLHICPGCGSSLVQPSGWEQGEDRSRWRIWRRCPECEWAGDGFHNEREIDDFDTELDLGAHELAEQLRSLQHANMLEMVDSFVQALSHDLIEADDFAYLDVGRRTARRRA